MLALNLFLWFMCKITIFKIIHNWLMIINFFKYINDNYGFIDYKCMRLIDKFFHAKLSYLLDVSIKHNHCLIFIMGNGYLNWCSNF
jgi:hypothetical protein